MLGGPLALEPQPCARAPAHERRQAPARSTSSAWRPTTCWPPCGRAWPPARRTLRPARSAVPDHVLARQTVDDCLHEGLSRRGSGRGVGARSSRARSRCTPSSRRSRRPFSHAILSGRPFTYLDDAPLEERRTRALSLRRGLGELGPDGLPVPADGAGRARPRRGGPGARPGPSAPARSRRAARPAALAGGGPARARTGPIGSSALVADGRASLVDGCWVATERCDGRGFAPAMTTTRPRPAWPATSSWPGR